MDRLSPQPLVSIVIPTVKNDPYIRECVEHIKRSSYQNYELLIICEGLERSAQRNIGIKKSKGKYIIWIDSDMMISNMLIEDCVRIMEDDEELRSGIEIEGNSGIGGFLIPYSLKDMFLPIAGIYIPEKISTKGWFGALRNWERQFYTGTLVDVMRFTRRATCPLFDETMHGPEDSDWERQCPKGRRAVSKYHFDHHDQIGLLKYLHKKAYYAKSLGKYKLKNPTDKVLTFKYRCFDVFMEKGKWKKFISNPIMALGVLTLVFLRGIIYLVAVRL